METQSVYRKNVIETLNLIASREEQLKYQRDVPIAYVSAELFCLWSDCFELEWLEDESYSCLFSSSEINALKNFDKVFHRVSLLCPDPLPSISEFILTPQWKELSQAATKALLHFDKND